jgi:hypothetical protein
MFIIKKIFNQFFDKIIIRKNSIRIIHTLSEKIGERNIICYENLENAKLFILNSFKDIGLKTTEEIYKINGKSFCNIFVEFSGNKETSEIILVGAHYDTIEGSAGANDNATGIAALIELGRHLSASSLKRKVRLVAFSTEEPPFFLTDNMGSMVHAKSCMEKKENIKIMISLDMLGYGSNFVKQKFPLERMSENCPVLGNFLTVISLPSYSNYAYLWKNVYNSLTGKKIHEFIAPASINGINLSDHSSFHKYGFPSILITDTGFYRNDNYHTENDLYNTINFNFLSKNISNICKTVVELANIDTIK